jgi:murein DD-endopeptidase MepM/ murein hydrolase activator NlpD
VAVASKPKSNNAENEKNTQLGSKMSPIVADGEANNAQSFSRKKKLQKSKPEQFYGLGSSSRQVTESDLIESGQRFVLGNNGTAFVLPKPDADKGQKPGRVLPGSLEEKDLENLYLQEMAEDARYQRYASQVGDPSSPDFNEDANNKSFAAASRSGEILDIIKKNKKRLERIKAIAAALNSTWLFWVIVGILVALLLLVVFIGVFFYLCQNIDRPLISTALKASPVNYSELRELCNDLGLGGEGAFSCPAGTIAYRKNGDTYTQIAQAGFDATPNDMIAIAQGFWRPMQVYAQSGEDEQAIRERVAGHYSSGQFYQVRPIQSDARSAMINGNFDLNIVKFLDNLHQAGIGVVTGPRDWGRSSGDHVNPSRAIDIFGAVYLSDLQGEGIRGFKTSGRSASWAGGFPDDAVVNGNTPDPRVLRHVDIGNFDDPGAVDQQAVQIFEQIYDIAAASGVGTQFIMNRHFKDHLVAQGKTSVSDLRARGIQDDGDIGGGFNTQGWAHTHHFHIALAPHSQKAFAYSDGSFSGAGGLAANVWCCPVAVAHNNAIIDRTSDIARSLIPAVQVNAQDNDSDDSDTQDDSEDGESEEDSPASITPGADSCGCVRATVSTPGGPGGGTGTVGDYDVTQFIRHGNPMSLNDEQIANIQRYAPIVERYARQYNLDPNILMAQILQESAFRNDVITGATRSSAGAVGVSQFLPSTLTAIGNPTTGRNFTVSEVLANPELGILAQAIYMRSILDGNEGAGSIINGDIILALAAYNAGSGNVQRYGGVPPFPETQYYVTDIEHNAKVFAGQIRGSLEPEIDEGVASGIQLPELSNPLSVKAYAQDSQDGDAEDDTETQGNRPSFCPVPTGASVNNSPFSGTFVTPTAGGLFNCAFGGINSSGTCRTGIRAHRGIDIAIGSGTPVFAAASGVVTVQATGCTVGNRSCGGGFGNWISIDHGNGVRTHYAHLRTVDVRTGQSVGQGQIVGSIGSTGSSTGPHLHFEVLINGAHRDPCTSGLACPAVKSNF